MNELELSREDMEELDSLYEEEERGIEIITEEILFYKRQAGGAIIEIGRRLNEAKELLEHGEWLPWLREKVDFSVRSAQNFMRLAKEYEKSAEIAHLGASKALALLALEDSEREEFLEGKHLVNGEEKSSAEMTLAELKQAIKERDEARAELNRERCAGEGAALKVAQAEEDRAKMAADMKLLNARLEGLNEEIALKERELKELRERPVEVAVQYQTDPAEIASARAEGEKAARAKAERAAQKAAAELDELRREKEQAEAEHKRAQAGLDNARAKLAVVMEDLEKARKEARQAGDKELAQFTLLFDQAQETVNRMRGILQKMNYSGRTETADKLRAALTALAGKIGEAAEG